MSELVDQGGQQVVGVSRVEGPIIVVEGAGAVGYDEVVEVLDSQGRIRRGRVLEVGEKFAVVEVFAGTTGLEVFHAARRCFPWNSRLGEGNATVRSQSLFCHNCSCCECPGMVAAFARVRELRADVFLANHENSFDLAARCDAKAPSIRLLMRTL